MLTADCYCLAAQGVLEHPKHPSGYATKQGHRKLGESRGANLSLTFKPEQQGFLEELKGATVPIIPSRIFYDCQLAT